MSTDEKEQKGLTRRDFIKGAAAGTVGGGVMGAAGTALSAPKAAPKLGVPAKWNEEADLVIVGYGGAGAATAIEAHDAGAKVLIIEKTPAGLDPNFQGGGGNTCMAGGVIVWPKDAVDGAKHTYALNWGTTPMSVCEAYANEAVNIPKWLDKMGVKWQVSPRPQPHAEFPNLPGAATITQLQVQGGDPPGRGYEFFRALDGQVKKRKIRILFSTPAKQLVQHPLTKEILGVIAENKGKKISIKARKAVILTCGGFEYNDVMMANYLRAYPYHFWGWPHNTGDGIRMAQEVGADLWHMNVVSGNSGFWSPDYKPARGLSPKKTSYIQVDKYGKRYANDIERTSRNHTFNMMFAEFSLGVPEFSRIPSFLICDETTREAGPLGIGHGIESIPVALGGAPFWSQDNLAEIAKGWVIKGDTIEALATAINQANIVNSTSTTVPCKINVNIDPAVLATTVADYNKYCAAKKDPDFDRPAGTLLPIAKPPFYAIPLWPGGYNTQGGPVRNEKSQILDTRSNPIRRLYSNGECGSLWGLLYPTGGGDLSELIVFSQIASRNAIAEKPWK